MTMQRTWSGRVFIGVSLDGMIARPDHNLDWLTDPPANPNHAPGHEGPACPPDYDGFMADIDHLVMGRRTYQKILTFDGWPYAAKQVIVLGTSLKRDSDDRITICHGIDETVDLLNTRNAHGVYVDGGQVVQEFLRHDLIDELIIGTAPVLIGDGIPLFGSLSRDVRLTHLGTSFGDSGMTSTRYAVMR
ncbi:MAG: dihydrofolate reductase family protein [Actinomycetota bacterium]|nr:dihydrofolate reductase family protein [Actinomycetota bacterium]